MQLPSSFLQKKTLIMEIGILVVFLIGMYYLYTMFSEPDTTTTSSQASEQLLGQNLTLFLKAVRNDKLSFDTSSFMNQPLIEQLQDFSETIIPASSRGRDDPFAPYAFTRPLR